MLDHTHELLHVSATDTTYGAVVRLLRRFAREPLFHFAVLGGLVFLGYGLMGSDQARNTIAVDDAKREELAVLFEQEHGRAPVDVEMEDMVERWVNSELLFREGVALGLDQTDSTIREMVVSKTRAMLQSRLAVPEPTEAELLEFFNQRKAVYSNPATATVTQYIVSPSEFDPVHTAAELRRQLVGGAVPDRPFTTQKDKPTSYFATVFGAEFAAELDTVATGEWRILGSRRGHHVVKVEARKPSSPRAFSEVRTAALKDWTERERRRGYSLALAQLREKYPVQMSGAIHSEQR